MSTHHSNHSLPIGIGTWGTQRAERAPEGQAGGVPRWTQRMLECAREWQASMELGNRDQCTLMRGEVWVLLSVGLAKYVRLHARNLPALPSGIQEDLVAEKAADLIQRIDRGSWDLARAETGSIAAMLSSAARNGIVDYLRKEAVRGGARNQRDQPVRELEAPREERAMDTLLGREYGRALADCILGLEPRARLIWVLGVFHGFSSKRIGGHPEVSRTPQAVDMAAHRSRKRVRDCMEGKGFDVDRMPSGSFVTVWEALNLDHRSGGSPSEVV